MSSGTSEATITINGQTLTPGQALAVRVAISTLFAEMRREKASEGAALLQSAYVERLSEVLMLLGAQPET